MIVLGGVIALELGGSRTSLVGMTGAAMSSPSVDAPAASASAEPTTSWVDPILARPLFAPSRRPPAGPVVATANAAPPRLSGIMITPAEREAVFTPANGPPIIEQEGGHIGGFTVRAIDPDRVVVTGPRGMTILYMSFDNAVEPAGASPAAPSPAAPFSLFNAISPPSGGIWTDGGKPASPNAATWPGPPPLSRLPVTQQTPASAPLLTPSGPPG